jgi:CRISPR-associated endonuclease/helicase Cas3
MATPRHLESFGDNPQPLPPAPDQNLQPTGTGSGVLQADTQAWWGKARARGDDATAPSYHPLPWHSLDVSATGTVLLQRLPALRRLLARRLGLSDDHLLRWTAFWLALHDLGKFAEAFQGQCPDLFEQLRGRRPDPARPYTLRHDSLGMLVWRELLRDRVIDEAWFGDRSEDLADGLDAWAAACTGHHGQPPKPGDTWTQHFTRHEDREAVLAFAELARGLFLDAALVAAIARQDPPSFHRASCELSWWLAGLAVLADWLGSDTNHFPYRVADGLAPSAYWALALEQAARAVDASGVVAPAAAPAQHFGDLFPGIPAPSPLQAWAAGTPLHDGPQIHLLEDVTGAGKTEAALLLTHRLMASGRADGFFVALPTMATANAMYGRIAASYARLFADPASLVLTHGQRTLVEDFAASVLPRGPSEDDPRQADETASARCSAWLADHNKRALLSPAGVGTIDQALLAVLHSKHQSLRLLGLLRKVLVVDEVHACDAYMQGVLEVLLTFHARSGGSAVLLSATLPQRMKQALLEAFACGLEQAAPRAEASGYPLASRWPADAAGALAQTVVPTRADMQRRVEVRIFDDIDAACAGILAALQAGRCVCWVRNTVADAVAAHARFSAWLPAEMLMLFHARYTLHDRLAMEEQVLAHFGRHGTAALRRGRLLIATQVVEQSLDVDFDLVVTDLAPIDRVIQRAGRLHRHRRAPDGTPLADPAAPDQRGTPALWLLSPPWTEDPGPRWFKAAFPRAAAVYPHHGQLWLTARALRAGSFTMPDDARRLIESVYGTEADIPPGLDANALAAEGQGYAAQTQAQMSTLKLELGYRRGGFDWWSEAQTPSRLGDASSTVTLARWTDGRLQPWVDRAHGWAYSSLRVAERLAAATAPPSGVVPQAALDAALAELPSGGRWTVLLPLVPTAQGWVGDTLAAARPGQAVRRVTWRYDNRQGLQRLDSAGSGPDTTEDPEA